jgi:hypothetical protein
MSPATQWVGAIVGIRTDSRIYPFACFVTKGYCGKKNIGMPDLRWANHVASQNTSLPGGEGFIPGRTSIIPRTALILTNFDKCPRSGSVS